MELLFKILIHNYFTKINSQISQLDSEIKSLFNSIQDLEKEIQAEKSFTIQSLNRFKISQNEGGGPKISPRAIVEIGSSLKNRAIIKNLPNISEKGLQQIKSGFQKELQEAKTKGGRQIKQSELHEVEKKLLIGTQPRVCNPRPLKLDIDQQAKHDPTNIDDYTPGRSQVTVDPYSLLPKVGTGTPVNPLIPRGDPRFRERIQFKDVEGNPRVIGNYIDKTKAPSDPLYSQPTTNGIIHYKETATATEVHIVPSRP
jgi:hypothetical protein